MGLDVHAVNTPIGLWAAREGATDAETVNFVVSTGAISSIPEPSSTLAMLALCLSSLTLRQRHKA